MFLALLAALGMREDQAVYLDDTGHMSGVDSLLGLDRAVRDGRVGDGDVVLLLAAGTGYTWAATVVRWGEIAMKAGEHVRALELDRDPAGEDRRVRRGDRRPPVDPRRPRAREGRPVRHDDRPRLPDALAAAGRVVRGDPARGRGWASTTASTASASRRRCPSARSCARRSRSQSVDEFDGGAQVTMAATVEREGGDKPVCVAEVVFRYYV